MTEEIIFVSLANTGVFEVYSVWDNESLNEAYNKFNKVLDAIGCPDTDIELQVAESENGINDRNVDSLSEFYEIQEETGEDLKTIVKLYDYYNNCEDVRKILIDGLYSIQEGEGFNAELDAFIGLCDDWGTFSEVPEQLKGYIDYKKYYQDWGYNGGTTIEIDYNTFMFINY